MGTNKVSYGSAGYVCALTPLRSEHLEQKNGTIDMNIVIFESADGERSSVVVRPPRNMERQFCFVILSLP